MGKLLQTAFGLILISVLCWAALPAQAEEAAKSTKKILSGYNEQVNIQAYHQATFSDGHVASYRIMENEDGAFPLEKRDYVGLDPVAGYGHAVHEDIVYCSGQTIPGASVTFTVESNGRTLETTADEQGVWQLMLSANTLEDGHHTVFMQSRKGEAVSSETELINIDVSSHRYVSNSTWLLFIIVGVAVVFVLVAMNLQMLFYRRARDKDHQTPPIAGAV